MKLKKIYIKNFKGIKEKKILEFNANTTLLAGPNGFGKTTIFDAIELCLTDDIHRTQVNAKVTSHQSNYSKAFYQNDPKKEVVIKLWLENIDGSSLIIVKHLPGDKKKITHAGRKFKPNDFSILGTYKDTEERFFEDNFDSDNSTKLENEELLRFFSFKSEKFDLSSIFKLFNYLQQEETTYFLKKSEKERKDDLSFLFQTEEQEEKLRRIERIFNKLKSGKEALENEILNFEIIEEKERPLFEKIFNDVEIDFDKPSLFDGLDHASADVKKTQYFEKLDKIKDFVDRFSPEVYEKKRKKKEFEAAILLFCTLN